MQRSFINFAVCHVHSVLWYALPTLPKSDHCPVVVDPCIEVNSILDSVFTRKLSSVNYVPTVEELVQIKGDIFFKSHDYLAF